MSRKNDEMIKVEEPLEIRVSNLKTKVIARLALERAEKIKQQLQHLDLFYILFYRI